MMQVDNKQFRCVRVRVSTDRYRSWLLHRLFRTGIQFNVLPPHGIPGQKGSRYCTCKGNIAQQQLLHFFYNREAFLLRKKFICVEWPHLKVFLFWSPYQSVRHLPVLRLLYSYLYSGIYYKV